MRLAGIQLIDATQPVETVLAQIRGAKLLITEAMHGAIVADALRTPWIGARPIYSGHHMKWLDWSGALDIDLRMHDLRPTSVLELYISMTGRGGGKGKAGRINKSPLARIPNWFLTHNAAKHLQSMAKIEPQLSRDAKIAEVTERAQDAVATFVQSRVSVS